MENNKEYVELSSLELTGKHICDINYKPNSTLIGAFVFVALMIALTIVTQSIYSIILGAFVLVYAIFVTKTVSDYRTLSIYDTYVLVTALSKYEVAELKKILEKEDPA